MAHTFEDISFEFIEKRRPNAKRKGLSRLIYNQFMKEHLKGEKESEWRKRKAYSFIREEAISYRPNFIPDLFEFYPDPKWREIVLWEVEDTGKLTRTKMAAIYYWMAELNGWADWDVKLIVTNRYGQGWTTVIDTREERAETLLKLRGDKAYLSTLPADHVAEHFGDENVKKQRTWLCEQTN